MHEEIEYAEMLEIPVSTVNVVKKSSRKKKQKTPERTENYHVASLDEASFPTDPLKDSVIAQVNNKLNEPQTISMENTTFDAENGHPEPMEISADAALFAESVNSDGRLDFDPIPERIDTVRLYSEENKRRFWERFRFKNLEFSFFKDKAENHDELYPEYPQNSDDNTPKWLKYTLNGEFIAACALCATIFLTNVFMPGSAINTFFRAVNGGETTATDTRSYADFQLSPVVSELSNAALNLSPTGILSFTEEGCVYPAANGTISAVEKEADGTYRVKISHSDSFTGVIGGLDYVYYTVGDAVKANVPVGYSDGETEVQVTMYSKGLLLNCFELTDENCLAWIEQN